MRLFILARGENPSRFALSSCFWALKRPPQLGGQTVNRGLFAVGIVRPRRHVRIRRVMTDVTPLPHGVQRLLNHPPPACVLIPLNPRVLLFSLLPLPPINKGLREDRENRPSAERGGEYDNGVIFQRDPSFQGYGGGRVLEMAVRVVWALPYPMPPHDLHNQHSANKREL